MTYVGRRPNNHRLLPRLAPKIVVFRNSVTHTTRTLPKVAGILKVGASVWLTRKLVGKTVSQAVNSTDVWCLWSLVRGSLPSKYYWDGGIAVTPFTPPINWMHPVSSNILHNVSAITGDTCQSVYRSSARTSIECLFANSFGSRHRYTPVQARESGSEIPQAYV